MKRVLSYLFILCAITMLCGGCEESGGIDENVDTAPEVETEVEVTITIPEEFADLTFDSVISSDEDSTIEQVIQFTATAPWVISIGEVTKAETSWVTVSPMSGDAGEAEITISLEVNDQYEDRSSAISIISGDATNVITVSQNAKINVEYQALIDLYNSTDGDNWKNNTNWCSDEPLSEWYGITLDDEEYVINLDLQYNSLSGSIPESIGNLGKLVYLYSNDLSGSIPESIGNLGNLEWLYLSFNSLSGSIPESIGNLGKLKWVRLYYNNLSGDVPQSVLDLKDQCYSFSINPQNNGYGFDNY